MLPVKFFFQPIVFNGAKIVLRIYAARVCLLIQAVCFIFEILQNKLYANSTHGRYDGKW